MDGFDELSRKLNELQQNADELSGEQNLTFEELFPDEFMTQFTDYSSMENMISQSQFEVESPEDFKAIPDLEWDDYVKSKTSFDNWDEMMEKAVGEYVARRLGLE